MKLLGMMIKGVVFVVVVAMCWMFLSGIFSTSDVHEGQRTTFCFERIKKIKELELLALRYGDIRNEVFRNANGKVVAYADYMYNGMGRLTIDLDKVEFSEFKDADGNTTNLVVTMPEVSGMPRIMHHSPQEETNKLEWTSGIIGDYKEADNVKLEDLDRHCRATAQEQFKCYMMSGENIERARKRAEDILRVLLEDPDKKMSIVFVWPPLP